MCSMPEGGGDVAYHCRLEVSSGEMELNSPIRTANTQLLVKPILIVV